MQGDIILGKYCLINESSLAQTLQKCCTFFFPLKENGFWIIQVIKMETSALSLCNHEHRLEDECHKITYSRKQGFLKFSSFSDEEKALIHWRPGISLDEHDGVCLHHEKLFSTRYKSLQSLLCGNITRRYLLSH